jgi:hypothetical protein
MKNRLPTCWEIEKCGREKGGPKESELGECIASKEGFGHSCWAVAGTLCGGVVQGTIAQKIGYCSSCEVYRRYNRSLGSQGKEIASQFPEEEKKYIQMLLKKSGKI